MISKQKDDAVTERLKQERRVRQVAADATSDPHDPSCCSGPCAYCAEQEEKATLGVPSVEVRPMTVYTLRIRSGHYYRRGPNPHWVGDREMLATRFADETSAAAEADRIGLVPSEYLVEPMWLATPAAVRP